jgi:hypothetical protein
VEEGPFGLAAPIAVKRGGRGAGSAHPALDGVGGHGAGLRKLRIVAAAVDWARLGRRLAARNVRPGCDTSVQMMTEAAISAAPPPLSPEALAALGKRARPLLPVLPQDRRYLLRDEAALLVDELLVSVARGSGALAVAMGECLDCLCSGDGPMQLGYSSIGDYAREALSLAPRTAKEWAKLARDLRTRPILRAAVRAGEVSLKKAEAIVDVALGDSEAEWVERAKRDTVRGLLAAAKGDAAPEERAERRWHHMVVELEGADRMVVDQALELAGKTLRANAPRWQRVEAIAQEYLGSHPPPPRPEQPPKLDIYEYLGVSPSRETDLREWLEAEYDRWSFLHSSDPVPAPKAGVDDWDRGHRIDERLRDLAAMRRGWDELLGHLSMLLVNTGLWRDMKFRDLAHYATERLGMSGRAIEQRAWLERRLWELPLLRKALRDGRLGYEKARLVARALMSADHPERRASEAGPESKGEAWIARAEKMTVAELERAVEADRDAQTRTRGELVVRLPEDVRTVFSDACRAVREAEGGWVGVSECLVVMCRHFVETYGDEMRPKTKAQRVMDRDRGLCTCPGCSKAADNVHHIEFRSHGGGDNEENLTSLCLAHHLHGVHKGYVRVRGAAPGGLRWELGEVRSD